MTLLDLIYFFYIPLIIAKGQQLRSTKLWYPMTDYNLSSNWNLDRLPCETDHIHFPRNINYLLTFGKIDKIQIASMELPMNGEIALPVEGIIEFSQNSAVSHCPGDGKSSEAWMDNKYWKIGYINDAMEVIIEEDNTAVPHLERIPCKYDTVYMPTYYRVILPDIPITINKMIIAFPYFTRYILFIVSSQTYLRWYLKSFISFNNFITSQFVDRENALQIKYEDCRDLKGCLCHAEENMPLIKQIVCSLEDCPILPLCQFPVQPVGHCCPICATIITLEINPYFFMTKLKNLVDVFMQPSKDKIHYYISRINSKQIQIVLKETKEYAGKSADTAFDLGELIRKDTKNLKIRSLSFRISGSPIILSRWYMQLLMPFGTLLLVLLGFGLLFLHTNQRFLILLNRWIPNIYNNENNTVPYTFARFVNVPINGEGESLTEDTPSNVEIARNDHQEYQEIENDLQSFSNPLFMELQEPIPSEMRHSENETLIDGSACENPIYTEMTEMDLITNK